MQDTIPATTSPASTNQSWSTAVLRHFSRVTSSGRYLPEIDGLRFIAIAWVVLFHVNESLLTNHPTLKPEASATATSQLLRIGGVGVPLFFTISGFILALPFIHRVQHSQSLRLAPYYLRRLTRLEPPYIVNLLVITFLLVAIRGDNLLSLIPHLIASLTYTHNLIFETMSRINPVTWSLEIEVQFYIIAPFLVTLLLRLGPTLRRSLLLVAILLSCILKASPHIQLPSHLRMSLPGSLEHFLVGILLADLYINNWQHRSTNTRIWDALGAAGWTAIIATQQHHYTKHFLPFCTLLAYAGTLRGASLKNILSTQPIAVIGGMCYTIYLYHFYVISLVTRFTDSTLTELSYLPAISLQCLLVIPLTLILSGALFVAVERPFMAWRPFHAVSEKRRLSSTAEETSG